MLLNSREGTCRLPLLQMDTCSHGTQEMNFGLNLDYTNQTHAQYDSTEKTNYIAMSKDYFLCQSYGAGLDWQTGGAVTWRFDNSASGGVPNGAKLTINDLWLAEVG